MGKLPESIKGLAEVSRVRGRSADSIDGRRRLLIEVPHGATKSRHFDELRRQLRGAYPEDLREFFFVNTDVGAPEVAQEIARKLVQEHLRDIEVVLVRGLLPRTFIDVNRVLGDAVPDYAATGLTPGLPDYVTDDDDRRLLRELHAQYDALARSAYEDVCGGGGLALILHSYAPRSVDIGRIDADVVRALRKAYEPARYERWPVRPDVEVIDRTPAGESWAPAQLATDFLDSYAAEGFVTGRNQTYALDPSTAGWVHSSRHHGRVLCVEINRALVADPFDPFHEMHIGADKVSRVAAPACHALARALGATARPESTEPA